MSVLFIDDGTSGRKIELSIYKVGTSYLLLKRSKMESPNIIIAMITAFSTVMVTLLGKVGFDRYKAKGETTVKLREIESAEVVFIVETLKGFKADATIEIDKCHLELARLRAENIKLELENDFLKDKQNS